MPGIISWPAGFKKYKLKAGSVSDEPVSGNDIFPTFLELAGIPLPDDRIIDGTSIMPIFKGGKIERKKPMYWRNNKQEFRVAMREGDWKIIANSSMTKFELFNLKNDPAETKDLSKASPERFNAMKESFIAIDKEVLNGDGPKWWQKGGWKKNFPDYVTE